MSRHAETSVPRIFACVVLFVFALTACARPAPTPVTASPPAAINESVGWRRSIPIFDVHAHIDPDSIEKTLAAMDANGIARMLDLTAGEDAAEFAASKRQFDARGKGRFVLYVNDVYAKHPIEDPAFGQKVAA